MTARVHRAAPKPTSSTGACRSNDGVAGRRRAISRQGFYQAQNSLRTAEARLAVSTRRSVRAVELQYYRVYGRRPASSHIPFGTGIGTTSTVITTSTTSARSSYIQIPLDRSPDSSSIGRAADRCGRADRRDNPLTSAPRVTMRPRRCWSRARCAVPASIGSGILCAPGWCGQSKPA